MAIHHHKRFGIVSDYHNEDYEHNKPVVLSNNAIVFLYGLCRDMEDVQPDELAIRDHIMNLLSNSAVDE